MLGKKNTSQQLFEGEGVSFSKAMRHLRSSGREEIASADALRKGRAILSLLLIVVFVLPLLHFLARHQQFAAASGSDLYVSTTGSDSNNCSQAAPCATITKASQLATPGTTVHVAPGTYSYFANYASGNASARIVFVSDTKWGAKLTASFNPTNNSNALIYNEGNYVDFQGFEVYGVNVWLGIKNEGSYDRIIGNKVHDLAQTCNDNSSGIDNANYSLPAVNDDIIGNIVYNVGPTTSCNTIQGIYHSISGGHILNNISFHNSGYGIHCWHGCTNVVVANNTTFNNGKGGLIFGDGDEGAGIFNNSIVSNNIAYNNAGTGIGEYEYSGQHTIGSNNQFLNNLTYGNPSGNMLLIEGNTQQNTVTQDPQFVNYQADGSGDYHLKATSPAIDAGTSLGAPSTDFDGNSRPQGAGFDIGPYIYVVAATPTPTPFGLSFEAESGTITAPFQVTTGTPTYISQTVNASTPSQGGLATYTFSIPTAGDYIINTSVNAPDTNTNSFYVNIDSDPANDANAEAYEVWDIYPFTIGFQQRTVSWRGNGTFDNNQFAPKVFTLSAGTHTLYIRGREANTQLDSITITPYAGATNTPIPTNTPTPVPPTFTPTPFVDTTPPTITITNPANGSSVKRGSTVTIAANASDNVGVTRVTFFVNGSLLCSDTTSPYSCAWTVPGKRGVTYTITAKAYDAAGNTGTRTVKVTSF